MTKDLCTLQNFIIFTAFCFSLLSICSTTSTVSYFNFDLSATTLDPTTMGFKITGEASASSLLGSSVRTAGDVNKDGYDDIIIGANGYSSNKGRAYVIYGGETADLVNIDLTTPLDPHTTGFTITGGSTFNLGYSVSTAGDIDGDGYDDIIVGAYGYSGASGAAFVIYGGEKTSMQNIDLSSVTLLPSISGFMISGSAGADFFGWCVSTAGDINNDGFGDIIVGAFGNSGKKGKAYVIYGGKRSSMQNLILSSTTLLPSTTGFTLTGKTGGDQLGFSVNTAGDINKDGYDDIIIGANGMTSAGLTSRGAAYVIYGGEKSDLRDFDFGSTTIIPSTTGFILSGKAASDELGISVSTAGDTNNDGYADIIVGFKTSNTQGGAYVIYGGKKSSMANYDFITATLTPSTTGFTIKGQAAGGIFGWPVSVAGDLNKDGYNDLIVGAYGRNSNKGAAYIIYGGKTSSRQDIDLSTTALNPLKTGFVISGNAANDQLGLSVSIAGDINGDGFEDIIIGANAKNSNVGAVYVIHTACAPCWDCSIANCNECLTSATVCTECTSSYLVYHQSQCFSTCPETSFAASTTACEDCSTNCKTCSSPTACSECLDSYFLYQSQCYSACPDTSFAVSTTACQECPANCNKCSDSTSCTECLSPYLVYQSQCLSACPDATFTSGDKCEDCPANCLSCASQTSCKACSQGYTLSNSVCILSTSTSTYGQDQAKASQAVSSATQALGGIVSVGSATFPITALVSKTVQNTRYLNLSVTTNLADIYQTWGTNIISWDVPNVISDFDDFKESPPLFYQYGIDSSFLTNFWPTLVNIGIGLTAFVISIVLKKFSEQAKYDGWGYSLLQKLVAGSFNFTLVQAYACLDDILFYLVIDAKTNPFNSFFSWTSLISASVFLTLGCLLVFFNFWTVKKYQGIKNQNVKDLDAFNEKNKYWELFYSDFNDDDLLSQSFFAFLIMRSTLSSFIITVFYDYPLMQTSFLMTLDGAIILFLFFKNPFKTLHGTLCQYYFEIITLLVHICTFILSFQDSLKTSSDTLRTVLSTGIIYLNTALVSGSIGFMFIGIYKTISEKRKARKLKQSKTISVQTAPEDSLDFVPVMSSSGQHFETEAQRNQETWVSHNNRTTSFENFHLLSGFRSHNNTAMYDFHLEPSQTQDFNQITDDSFRTDMNPNYRINQSRELSPMPVFIRPLPRSLRQNAQKKRTVRLEDRIHPGRFANN